ncbi:hypothetical protein Tco_1453148, partial [Tanacetum coccineum]
MPRLVGAQGWTMRIDTGVR